MVLNHISLITNENYSLLFSGESSGSQRCVASRLTDLETQQPPNQCIKYFFLFTFHLLELKNKFKFTKNGND